MRQIFPILVLPALSTVILGHVTLESNEMDSSSDIPDIPHPYWWQGSYTESLKENAYGSNTPFRPPTLLPTTEEPCETESTTPMPTRVPIPSETNASVPYPAISASSDHAASTSFSQGMYSPSPIPEPQYSSVQSPTFLPSLTPGYPAGYSSSSPSQLPAGSSLQAFSSPCSDSGSGYSPPPGSTPGYFILPTGTDGYQSSTPTPTMLMSYSQAPALVSSVEPPTSYPYVAQPAPSQLSSMSYLLQISPSYGAPSYQSQLLNTATDSIPASVSSIVVSIYTISAVGPSATPSQSESPAPTSTEPPPEIKSTLSLFPSFPSSLATGLSVPQSTSSDLQASPSVPLSTPSSLTTLATQTVYTVSGTISPSVSSMVTNPSRSRTASTYEPSSVRVAATSVQTLLSKTTAPRSSATAQATSIPLAPSAGGASGGGLNGRGKEKVWWVAFLVPLFFAACGV